MKSAAKNAKKQVLPTASLVRKKIDSGGERLWRLSDFSELSPLAVAQTLSRLAKAKVIQRLSKGIYYHGKETPLGPSRPNPAKLSTLARHKARVYPAGITAANLLGLSTQAAARAEVATSALSLPRKLIGQTTIVHTRRPESWNKLSEREAAILEVLRRRGALSELPEEEITRRVRSLISEPNCFKRLAAVMDTEPPRVRAIFGALGEGEGQDKRILTQLKDSLNPFSRFDFGLFSGLRSAKNWQAKEAK